VAFANDLLPLFGNKRERCPGTVGFHFAEQAPLIVAGKGLVAAHGYLLRVQVPDGRSPGHAEGAQQVDVVVENEGVACKGARVDRGCLKGPGEGQAVREVKCLGREDLNVH